MFDLTHSSTLLSLIPVDQHLLSDLLLLASCHWLVLVLQCSVNSAGHGRQISPVSSFQEDTNRNKVVRYLRRAGVCQPSMPCLTQPAFQEFQTHSNIARHRNPTCAEVPFDLKLLLHCRVKALRAASRHFCAATSGSQWLPPLCHCLGGQVQRLSDPNQEI